MTAAIREGQIYVFDKNGIWRLRDLDGNDEADVHELFSNAFAQTADMREFPATIRLAPGGEFVIAKGGQQADTLGKHNGSVLKISADGRALSVLGYGFRQPNIGVNLRTGLVTASDQQGHYIPSTPLHIVQGGQYYGFLEPFLPKEQYPAAIADPLVWLPHAVNASGLSQVWLFDAKMGPLNGRLLHIGFNRPELFQVLLNTRSPRTQATVVSVTRQFSFPLLNGSVNPLDGQLYIAGFQIVGWGNVSDTPAGFARIRYTGSPATLPSEVVPMAQGVLIRFDQNLDPHRARDPKNYELQSWHYRRSFNYGSPQFKDDGTPGQDPLPVSAAYLSLDGRSVFVAVPNMRPVMQLKISWSISTPAGQDVRDDAYTTVYELPSFDPQAEGFGPIQIDLTQRASTAESVQPVNALEGRKVAEAYACIACHATERGITPKSGPTWVGLYGSKHPVVVAGKRDTVTADADYLRESILQPAAKHAVGFDSGEYAMPSYAGILSDAQIESLILYIQTLK